MLPSVLKSQFEACDNPIKNLDKPSRIPPLDIAALNITNIHDSSRRIVLPEDFNLIQRLVFIISNEEVNEALLSKQIWNLAANLGLDVLLISRVKNMEEHLAAARRLATMKSMIRDSKFRAEILIVSDKSWVKIIQSIGQPADVIFCSAEAVVKNPWGKTYPFSDFLAKKINTPIMTFSGLYQKNGDQSSQWLKQLIFWFISLLIICFSLIFEIDVAQTAPGTIGQMVLLLIVAIEIGLLYKWALMTDQ